MRIGDDMMDAISTMFPRQSGKSLSSRNDIMYFETEEEYRTLKMLQGNAVEPDTHKVIIVKEKGTNKQLDIIYPLDHKLKYRPQWFGANVVKTDKAPFIIDREAI